MKSQRFAITSSASAKGQRTANVRAYCGLLFFAFCVFAVYSGVINMLFAPNKVDIFTKDLTQIATYFLPVDREVSEKLLTLDDIIQSYLQGDNVLQTKTDEIEELWLYITEKKDYLSKLGFKNYDAFMNFIAEAYENRNEIYTLL
ncbi:MAG: hypothetical protein LBO09_08375 [Candidatus Peribacteria bacterium]|jgi:dsDNA-binding SOS-regulon protein|nr:hypothetical protein [Candidatus Peribacteria bacterium]